MTREQWEKISRRVKTDLKSFARRKSGTGSLEENLEEITRERYDYSIYPEQMPAYQVVFAFLEEDGNRASAPPWSMKVVL